MTLKHVFFLNKIVLIHTVSISVSKTVLYVWKLIVSYQLNFKNITLLCTYPVTVGRVKLFFFFTRPTDRSTTFTKGQQYLVLECLIKKTCLYLMAWSLVIQMEKKKSDHLLDNGWTPLSQNPCWKRYYCTRCVLIKLFALKNPFFTCGKRSCATWIYLIMIMLIHQNDKTACTNSFNSVMQLLGVFFWNNQTCYFGNRVWETKIVTIFISVNYTILP